MSLLQFRLASVADGNGRFCGRAWTSFVFLLVCDSAPYDSFPALALDFRSTYRPSERERS
jgi:hypothetical protein